MGGVTWTTSSTKNAEERVLQELISRQLVKNARLIENVFAKADAIFESNSGRVGFLEIKVRSELSTKYSTLRLSEPKFRAMQAFQEGGGLVWLLVQWRDCCIRYEIYSGPLEPFGGKQPDREGWSSPCVLMPLKPIWTAWQGSVAQAVHLKLAAGVLYE